MEKAGLLLNKDEETEREQTNKSSISFRADSLLQVHKVADKKASSALLVRQICQTKRKKKSLIRGTRRESPTHLFCLL